MEGRLKATCDEGGVETGAHDVTREWLLSRMGDMDKSCFSPCLFFARGSIYRCGFGNGVVAPVAWGGAHKAQAPPTNGRGVAE